MNHKRKKRKLKTINGYLRGDGPRGNSKKDQKKQQRIADIINSEQVVKTPFTTICDGRCECE